MKQKTKSFTNKLSFKLFTLVAIVIIVTIATSSYLIYTFAKQRLIEAGRADLMHIVNNAAASLSLLDEQVQLGKMTIEEAQQEARVLLNGPETKNSSLYFNYKEVSFRYKELGYVYAFNSQYKTTLHPVLPIGQDETNFQNEQGQYVIRDLVKTAKLGEEADRFYEYSWKNKGEAAEAKKVAYVTYFEPWDWTIGIGAYEEEFYESLSFVGWITFILACISTILSVLLFYFFSKGKLKALLTVTAYAKQLSEGDLTVSLLSEKDKDEIGDLSHAFNLLVSQLREMTGSMKQTGDRLSEASTYLSSLTAETSAAGQEISHAMNEITKGGMSQATDLEQMSERTKNLTAASTAVAQQNSQVVVLAEGAAEAAHNGREQITSLQAVHQYSSQVTHTFHTSFSNLYVKVKDISQIASSIKQIADQTNLLALNASIEAARAGEHGYGFAVVADEVRKLAEETNMATQQIHDMILGIKMEAESTLTAMADTKHVSEQLNEAILDTEKQFNSISSFVDTMLHSIQQSKEETETIQSTITHFSLAVQNIATVIKQTLHANEEIAASTEEQAHAIRLISDIASKLENNSKQLYTVLSQYKL